MSQTENARYLLAGETQAIEAIGSGHIGRQQVLIAHLPDVDSIVAHVSKNAQGKAATSSSASAAAATAAFTRNCSSGWAKADGRLVTFSR